MLKFYSAFRRPGQISVTGARKSDNGPDTGKGGQKPCGAVKFAGKVA
ncbi:MAG: hypothetical protein ACUVSC_05720 [Candidatus Fervidibacter sp.]